MIHTDMHPPIRDDVAFYQNKGMWWVQLFLLMPDHLHALISFDQIGRSMCKTIQGWKCSLKRSAGIHWQRGYLDLRLRNACTPCNHAAQQIRAE